MIENQLNDVDKFIREECYMETNNNDPEHHYAIIDWLQQAPNTPDKFRHVFSLVKFYGIPFLYECRALYSSLTVSDHELLAQELAKLAGLAKSLLGDDIPKELEFLFAFKQQTSSKSIIPPHRPSERELKFINYWKSVRKAVGKIENLSIGNYTEQEKIVEQFLENEIKDEKEFSTFENRVIDVYLEKVYQRYSLARSVEVQHAPPLQKAPIPKVSPMEIQDDQEVGIPLYSKLGSNEEDGWKVIQTGPGLTNPNWMPETPQVRLPPPIVHPTWEELPIQSLPRNPEPTPSKNFHQEPPRQALDHIASRPQEPRPPTPPPYTRNKQYQPENPPQIQQRPPTAATKGRQPICCRRFFFKGEVLEESESLTLEFKNYSYPWNDELRTTLTKVVVGFLNRSGGILLIGVAEDNTTKRPTVFGSMYNEATKELLNFEFTKLMKKIYPDILSNSKIDMQFVPVRKHSSNDYIPGCYVIRVIVEYGERDRVYFFTANNEDIYVFRTQKQVIRRETKAALDEQVVRARKPLQIPPKQHEGYCLQPEIGRPIYGDPMTSAPRARQDKEQNNDFVKNGPWSKQSEAKQPERNEKYQKNHQEQQPRISEQPKPYQKPAQTQDNFFRQKQGTQQHYRNQDAQQNLGKQQPYPGAPPATGFIYRVAIKLPRQNPEKFVGNLLSGIPQIQTSYTHNKNIVAIALPKGSEEQLQSNLIKLKKTSEDAKAVILIMPTVTIEFRGNNAHEMFAEACKKLSRQSTFQIDKPNQLLSFKNIRDSIGIFLQLVDLGFFPRFTGRG